MSKNDVNIIRGFPEAQRNVAAELYYDAFSGKIGKLMGSDGRAQAYIARMMDPDHVISALSGDGKKLLGFAGFKTERGALVGGSLADFAATYGWIGALWRAPLLGLLERNLSNGQLLMDGIAVASEARGQGIGSRLLSAVIEETRMRGLAEVRLDVIDTNPRAHALYKRFGFSEEGVEKTGPLAWLFGFSHATRMVYKLGP